LFMEEGLVSGSEEGKKAKVPVDRENNLNCKGTPMSAGRVRQKLID